MRPPTLVLVAFVTLLAGCGGAPEKSDRAGRELAVTATDLRLGGAEYDDGSGPRRLSAPTRPDPDGLTAEAPPREGVAATATCPGADLEPTAENLDAVTRTTLCLLNAERAKAGRGPLSTNGRLADAAIGHSRDMVARSYFGHRGLGGTSSTDRIRKAGYIRTDGPWRVGENLAWGTGVLSTPRNVVLAWMRSPSHRVNLLRDGYNEIGLGIVLGNPKSADGFGATYATTFGSLGRGVSAVPRRKVLGRSVGLRRSSSLRGGHSGKMRRGKVRGARRQDRRRVGTGRHGRAAHRAGRR